MHAYYICVISVGGAAQLTAHTPLHRIVWALLRSATPPHHRSATPSSQTLQGWYKPITLAFHRKFRRICYVAFLSCRLARCAPALCPRVARSPRAHPCIVCLPYSPCARPCIVRPPAFTPTRVPARLCACAPACSVRRVAQLAAPNRARSPNRARLPEDLTPGHWSWDIHKETHPGSLS